MGLKITGSCRICRKGVVLKQWGGIYPQYYCNKCGIVTSYPGKKHIYMGRKSTISHCIHVINMAPRKRIGIGEMMYKIHKMTGRMPVLDLNELLSNGYRLSDGNYIEVDE